MGHGILSGSPFHMIGGWTTDMSVDYAELHRWEREEGQVHKRRRSNFRRRSAKNVAVQNKMPGSQGKVIRSRLNFAASKYTRPKGYTSLSSVEALEIINSANFDALSLNLKIFCTGYGLGMYSRTKGKYDSLCFETTTHTLKLYEIKELFKTGKVIFLRPEIQTMKKLPKQLTTTNTVSINSTPSAINAKKESEEKRKRKQIFQNIPCVRISCILDNLQVGQLVINYQLRVGKITALTDEKVIVDFGRNSKKYRIPLDFINQKLKIWGILYGKVYGSTERDLLLEKFDIIRKKIDSTNL